MPPIVVECDPSLLKILEEEKYLDNGGGCIYDHLKYYYSQFSTPPVACDIVVLKGSPVVKSGYKLVKIALELGRKSIRAIIDRGSNSQEVQSFIHSDGVRVLDWDAIRREEREMDVVDAVHVYFFEVALSEPQRKLFEERIAGYFLHLRSGLLHGRDRVIPEVIYSHDGHCAQFIATTPAGDESWFGDYYRVLISYSWEVAKIVSYQGHKFRF